MLHFNLLRCKAALHGWVARQVYAFLHANGCGHSGTITFCLMSAPFVSATPKAGPKRFPVMPE